MEFDTKKFDAAADRLLGALPASVEVPSTDYVAVLALLILVYRSSEHGHVSIAAKAFGESLATRAAFLGVPEEVLTGFLEANGLLVATAETKGEPS